MNQSGWIILLTLLVSSKCDSLADANDPESTDLDLVESEQWQPNDEFTSDQPHLESNRDSEDIDPSASSQVESVKNQSELNVNLINMMKNHNLIPQLEQLKRNKPHLLNYANDGQQNLMRDLLKNMATNTTVHSADGSSQKNQDHSGKEYDIRELKKYYDQLKLEESSGVKEWPVVESSEEQHANHNYMATAQWRPLISTSEHRLVPLGQPRHSYHAPSDAASEMPTSLANFYVDSDNRHAHESQNKDLKEAKDTSSNVAMVKDLISTKDLAGSKVDKLSSLSHKQAGYVPVENVNDKYHEYLSCCEHLFKNYANKDYYHEDIYLVPKGEDKYPMGEPIYPSMKPPHVSYLRGYPLLESDMKLLGPGSKQFPPGKHIPVQCLEEQHHSGHLVPAYHATHHPPPMFHAPPAAFLLKKKLALIGKKYFFGK